MSDECDHVLCCRSVSGVDVDPDLVHMEMQDSSGGTVMFLILHVLALLMVGHTHHFNGTSESQI